MTYATNQFHLHESRSRKTCSATRCRKQTNTYSQGQELAAAQAKKLETQNRLAASKENTKRLETRLANLEKQASDLIYESQRLLRLPKEHETGNGFSNDLSLS